MQKKRKKANSGELAQVHEFTGAVEVNRTLDLLITNQLLYQLSYNGTLIENPETSSFRRFRKSRA